MDARAAAGEDVGPLCGLLFAVKDNIDVRGYPTVGGTPGLEGNFPELNSPLIDRLQAANGIVLGKVLRGMAEGIVGIFGIMGGLYRGKASGGLADIT